MTSHATARIYYKDNGRTPDFIIVVQDTQPIPTQLADVKIVETGDDHLAIATRALGEIGWSVADPFNARIVRQADGIGNLPVVSATTTPDTVNEPELTAHVSVGANGQLDRVKVGDSTRALPGGLPTWLGQPTLRNNGTTLIYAAIDRELLELGYLRTSPFSTAPTQLTCTVGPAQWRDHPTLVRVTGNASELLSRAAMTLGIPADVLASTWIMQTAADALRRHEWFLRPGQIMDHDRITGWMHDGSPRLTNTATMPTGRIGTGGSGS